jgi:hypothetical protein
VGLAGQGRSAGVLQQQVSKLAEAGVTQSSLQILDERIELAAVFFHQEVLHKVIDRLAAVRTLLPEKQPANPVLSDHAALDAPAEQATRPKAK